MGTNPSCRQDVTRTRGSCQRAYRACLGSTDVLLYVGHVESFSVQLSPKMIAYILLGVIVSIVLALSAHALIRERTTVAWKATIESTASTSTMPVQEFVKAEAVSAPTTTNQPDVLTELNRYWLERVNRLRQDKQLRILVTDQRLVTTAGEWAIEMERRGEVTHVRMDGKNMHQWIDAEQIDFTERGSENGWKRNYL